MRPGALLLLALAGLHAGCAAEAPLPASPSPLGEFLAVAEQLRRGSNPYTGQAPMLEIERQLQDANLTAEQRFELLYRLTGLKVQQNDSARAVECIEEALRLLEEGLKTSSRPETLQHALQIVLKARGLAYLTLAEDRNCVARHDPRSCIFPIEGGGVHVERGPAEQALQSFVRYLELRPDDHGARWLLNLAAMTIGRHPDAVPQHLRIALDPPRAEPSIEPFVNVAGRLGIDTFNSAGGVIVEDFDGDGYLDIVTSTFDPAGPLTYYRSRGDGGFENLSGPSGLDRQLGGLNAIGTDYDNDGDPDILVLRGAWLFHDGQIRNSLLRNNGDGTFSDITRRAGLADPPMPTQAAVWGDYDNDGDLDLYIGNESPADRSSYFPAQLFRNNGDETFTDVAVEAGVTNEGYAKGVAAGDYDNDGDLDLYVSNVGANRLYRNDGDGTFTDVAPELGVTGVASRSFAPWFFDYDNDGWLDLFVGAYDAKLEDVARDYQGLAHDGSSPSLYHNHGDGTFTDVAPEMGLDRPWLPMGASFGDVDNDGFQDIYLGTGNPGFETLVPNVLLRNDRGRRFVDVTTGGGLGHLQKGHGIAFADFDHDGDQDIYHQLGGFYPGDAFANALFLNPGGGGHYLKLRLIGLESNRLGVGARIRVVVEGPDGTREIHRAVGSVSSFGGSSIQRQEIGLGDATRIAELSVWWPASGIRTTYRELPLDSLLELTEGAAETRRLPHRLLEPDSTR